MSTCYPLYSALLERTLLIAHDAQSTVLAAMYFRTQQRGVVVGWREKYFTF